MPAATTSLLRGGALLGTAGLAVAATGAVERHRPVLRRVEVPGALGSPGPPLRVLHLSDLHITSRQRVLPTWVSDLGRLVPDLVVVTGDVLGGRGAVPAVLSALGPLLHRPGLFVPGNNDDLAPRPPNPLRYLRPGRHPVRPRGAPLPWPEVADAFTAAGWHDVTNRRVLVEVAGRRVDVLGLDDPTRHREQLSSVAVAPDPAAARDADLALGVVHTPEPAVLDGLVAAGARLLLAGHTHGGQIRLPGIGALSTNCGLPRSYARGLSSWPGPSQRRGGAGEGGAAAQLHVSAGLGTSPWVPVRLRCPPEATLLTLLPA